MIVAIVFSLIPIIVPIPMIAVGLMSGVLQAFIITTLGSLYISSGIEISAADQKVRRFSKGKKQNCNFERNMNHMENLALQPTRDYCNGYCIRFCHRTWNDDSHLDGRKNRCEGA